MPLYDYQCNKCNTCFEALRKLSESDSIDGLECQSCGSTDVIKQMSTPSINTEGCPGYDFKWRKNSYANTQAMIKDKGHYRR
jgi:putative FmdB family regulatory protein